MQQQQPPTLNSAASFSPNAITTEQIQKDTLQGQIGSVATPLVVPPFKCLDDNKNLIMAIMENQNLGKFQECAQYQAMLQKNLMYLAAIADAQPPAPQTPNPSQVMQMPPSSIPQQANNYMQQGPQSQQSGQNLPFQLNALRTQDQQLQLLHMKQQLLQQQQGQMGLRPGAQNNMLGMHQAMQSALAGNSGKQDGTEAASGGGGDGQGKSRGAGGNRDS